MSKGSRLILACLIATCTAAGDPGGGLKPVAPGDYSELPANPFGFPNVMDFHGRDVLAFAQEVQLDGGPTDPNAELWTAAAPRGKFDSIDGEWAARWNNLVEDPGKGWTSGRATIRSLGSRVFILYEELKPATEPYRVLVEAALEGDRLVGRFANPKILSDTSPWVGKIVSPYRIDGQWPVGRWDFRRGELAAGTDGLK
jgi:hypothetical protein